MNSMERNERICILCNESKAEIDFNCEHVIPETIGGVYIIKSVCRSCNERLGKTIDTPLVNHKIMLVNRHDYNIKRGGYREIPNPFKGAYVRDNGDKYFVQFDQKGVATANIIPRFQDDIIQGNKRLGRLTLSKKDIDKAPRILNRELTDRDLFMLNNKIPDPLERKEEELIILEKVSNNPLIFGALKIAFEFCHEVVSDYDKDHVSEKFRKILLNPVDSSEVKKTMLEDPEIKKAFGNRILGMHAIKRNHHLLFLTPIKNKGTYCFVKLFQMAVLFKMSSSELIKNEVVLVNDAKTGDCGVKAPVKLNSFNLQVISYNGKSKLSELLSNSKGQVPVFDEKGVQLFDHLDQLLGADYIVPKREEFISKRMKIRQDFSNDKFYLKPANDEGFLKVESIEFDLVIDI